MFSKEWYGYNYNTSCTAKDAINAMDDSIIRKFNGVIPDNITLRTDNGPQYISKEFNRYLKTMGINHEYIEKETPTENGDIESFQNSTAQCLVDGHTTYNQLSPVAFLHPLK